MKNKLKEALGFTLVELLIAVAIVGILAAVAYPSYTSSLQKSRRVDAINTLMDLQMQQERYRANNRTYASDLADLSVLESGGTYLSVDGYYAITIAGGDATSYTLTATPRGDQAGDAGNCANFVVTQAGPDVDNATKKACWNQ